MQSLHAYEQSNPVDIGRLWHIQEPLIRKIEGLNKKHHTALCAAQNAPAGHLSVEYEYCRQSNQALRLDVDSGRFKNKDVIFVPGLPKPSSGSIDYLIRSLGRAHLRATQRCKEKKVLPMQREVFVGVAPMFFEIAVPVGALEMYVQATNENEQEFKATFYDTQLAKKVFNELAVPDVILGTYLNKRITAAACQTIIDECRRAYLYCGRASWLGTISGIFKHVPAELFEELGGRGGALRNADFPRRGIADKSAENILAGFLADKWAAQATS